MKTKALRLFKRLNESEPGYTAAPYYFEFQYKKRRYLRCLETPLKEEAARRAKLRHKEIVEAVQREDYPTLERLKMRVATTATVAQLMTAYDTAPVDANEATRTRAKHALRQLLRTAGHAEPDRLTVAHISGAVARAWFKHQSERAQAEPDQTAALSLKRSANGRFIQAAGLFLPKALDTYKQAGCHHPAFAEFLQIGQLLTFSRLPDPDFNPPPDPIIKATLAAWELIEDRELFLAIGHELAFGLRRGEVAQARWSWWQIREGYPVLDGQANVKGKTGYVQVRALDPFHSTLRARITAKGWRGEDHDYIIQGADSYRTSDIFRETGEWLRQQGWQTRKTNHALRAYAGSQVAMRYGIYEAQTWLRHSTVKVTEKHYSHFIKRFRPSDPSTLPTRWATLDTPPILRLAETA